MFPSMWRNGREVHYGKYVGQNIRTTLIKLHDPLFTEEPYLIKWPMSERGLVRAAPKQY